MTEERSPRRENFSRLQEEHERALSGSRDAVKKWEQFKYDYEVLQARLHTLPDKLTHDIMVPFGRFGFIQGQLYHTNEVMVLLGDNWFASRTARQAIEIAERRKKYVVEMLERERKVLTDLEARTGFVEEIATAASQVEQEKAFEIREPFDPEEEERRRDAKRREREKKRGGVSVPPPRPAFPKKTRAAAESERAASAGREESERGKTAATAGRETSERGKTAATAGRETSERGKTAASSEEMKNTMGKREAQEEGGDSGWSSHDGGHTHKNVSTITFRHTPGHHTLSPVVESVRGGGVGGVAYLTPADIARPGDNQGQQTHPAEGEEEEGKRVQWDPELVQHQESQGEAEATPPPTPFSPLVKEKQDLPLQTQEQSTSRKVSKFKLSRTGQLS